LRLEESGKEAFFIVEEAEVELTVTLAKSASVEGGVDIRVIPWLGAKFGASGERSRSDLQRIKLSLRRNQSQVGGVAKTK
jgi:hypothetical protein